MTRTGLAIGQDIPPECGGESDSADVIDGKSGACTGANVCGPQCGEVQLVFGMGRQGR